MAKYRHKFYITPKYLIAGDSCPKCREHFKKKRIKILWHDVLECTACGHIWVAIDYQEALKWLQTI